MAGQDYWAWSYADIGNPASLSNGDTFTVDATATHDILSVTDGLSAGDQPTDFGPTESDQIFSGTLDGTVFTNQIHQYESGYQITDGTNTFIMYWVNYGPNKASNDPTLHSDGFFVTVGGTLDPGTTYTILNTDVSINFDNGTGFELTPEYGDFYICFARGTLIETETGMIAVENLKIGDRVKTLDNGGQELRWIGSRRVAARRNLAPVCIQKGAIGNSRDLIVSPQHRILLTGPMAQLLFGEPEVLVAAKYLICLDQVYIRKGGEVEYFHLLFDRHEIIFSEGIPTESFYPGANAMSCLAPETRSEVLSLFPELENCTAAYGQNGRINLKSHEAAVFLACI